MEEFIYFIDNSIQTDPDITLMLAGISYCDGSYNISRNHSDVSVLEYILEGEGTLVINQKIYTPKKGDCYLLPQGINQYYYSSVDHPWVKIWINFRCKDVNKFLSEYNLQDSILFHGIDIESYLRKIVEYSKNSTPENLELCKKTLLEAFDVLKASLNANDKNTLLAEAIKHEIDDKIYTNVTLKQISDHFQISSQHCIRVFKKSFQMTPYQYILEQKLSLAQNYLTTSDMSIKDIAVKLCFADEFYFSNVFKKKFHMSPSKYRNTKT